MTPTLLLLHGWGFSPAFWDAFRAALPELPMQVADLGYFGRPSMPQPEGPVVVVGHSIGALLALRSPPPGCVGLVAINGFDRFTAPSGAGVAPRVVDRMIARLAIDPAATVADFRARCGDRTASGIPDPIRLGEHLQLLREADERERAAQWTLPLLHVSGGKDPILPETLRRSAFACQTRIQVTLEDGGHLLPITHASWCADMVRAMVQPA